jgi:tetratricopeptide (TPR) repeat protein
MKGQSQRLLSTLFIFGLSIHAAIAQPSPSPSPSPTLSEQERQELEQLREEKRIQTLIQNHLRNNAEIRQVVADEVDQAFAFNTNLLNVLITVLTLMPIVVTLALLLMRRSVINQVAAEVRTQLQDEVEKQLSEEVRHSVVDKLVSETIRRLQKDLEQQSIATVLEIRQHIADLQSQFTEQLLALQIQTAEALERQAEKAQLLEAINELIPSPAQEDSVSSEIQRQIQELTEQLEMLKSATPQLLLTASDYSKQGEAFYFEGRYEDALRSYDEAIRLKPDDPTTWINRAITLRRLDRFAEAIASHDQAIALAPDYPRVWYTKGYTLRRCHRYEAAIACYDRSIELDPGAYRSWDNRGSAFKEMGNYEEAIASYERAIQIQPDYANVWHHKARCYALWGKLSLAIDCLKKAIELNPDYRTKALTDPDFDSIRETELLQNLISNSH